MHKREFILKLEKFLPTTTTPAKILWPGQRSFAAFLVSYLEKLVISNEEEDVYWSIEPHLPKLMVSAFEELRTSIDQLTVHYRRNYEAEVGHKVPNIVDFGASDFQIQSSTVDTMLAYMLRDITGQNEIVDRLKMYCFAQRYVLQQAFDKFFRLVYSPDMSGPLSFCQTGMMYGNIGATRLLVERSGARVRFMFTTRDCPDQIVFFADKNGPLCLNAVIHLANVGFTRAFSLIEDVTLSWPKDEKEQKAIFVEQPQVTAVA